MTQTKQPPENPGRFTATSRPAVNSPAGHALMFARSGRVIPSIGSLAWRSPRRSFRRRAAMGSQISAHSRPRMCASMLTAGGNVPPLRGYWKGQQSGSAHVAIARLGRTPSEEMRYAFVNGLPGFGTREPHGVANNRAADRRGPEGPAKCEKRIVNRQSLPAPMS